MVTDASMAVRLPVPRTLDSFFLSSVVSTPGGQKRGASHCYDRSLGSELDSKDVPEILIA